MDGESKQDAKEEQIGRCRSGQIVTDQSGSIPSKRQPVPAVCLPDVMLAKARAANARLSSAVCHRHQLRAQADWKAGNSDIFPSTHSHSLYY